MNYAINSKPTEENSNEIKTDMNETEREIIKAKASSLKKISKTGKPLARLTKQKRTK